MLLKRNRLKKKKDFEKVFKAGRGVKEDFLFLKTIKNNLKESRFGFIIPQEISKKATTRNRIKRKLRGLVRAKMPKIKKGFDIILIAHPGLEIKDFWEIEEFLDKILKKANLLKS